jgi:iron(II)-dependent oxidoreductase
MPDTDMVAIPGGIFVMGRDDGPSDERPGHRLKLSAFLIDRLPVTNMQFAAFLGAEGAADAKGRRYFDLGDPDARIFHRGGRYVVAAGYENHPVVEASWIGAVMYCRWLLKRLPSEAEWERAARGTEGRPYPWGAAPPTQQRARFDLGWNETMAVGQLTNGATPEVILDLAGNVYEWTASLYRPYPYRPDDGREAQHSPGERVTRGGAHDSIAAHIRATWRGAIVSRNPNSGHHNIGFRCARNAS